MMSFPSLKPCLPLPIHKHTFNEIVEKAKDWALMHGAAMRSKKDFNPYSLNFAPFTLIPSTFPMVEFEKAVKLQPILNILMHRVAHDHEFLQSTLENTIKADEFTAKLYQIYETVRHEGFTQAISLGLLRGDYLINYPDDWRIKQVEINTVSSSLAGLSPCISRLHRFVLRELGRDDLLEQVPDNNALAGLCDGLISAWDIYNKRASAILFVVEDVTYNICDQRFHEFFIRNKCPHIKVFRRTLTEIAQQGQLGPDKSLLVDNIEVAVVYFRSGYEPLQYPSQKEWNARLLMERSLAIKCPSIQYHLAGTKKVQEALARPGVLEKFMKCEEDVMAVRDIFTGIYSLDLDDNGNDAANLALKDPERFVLKPQREGGGNNVYGQDVRIQMSAMLHSEERMGWILMDRIHPPVQETYIIRPGVTAAAEKTQIIVSELGIFGVIIGDKDNVLKNEQCGHMLRTKLHSADEGGVAAGAGCLDSPFLVDVPKCCKRNAQIMNA